MKLVLTTLALPALLLGASPALADCVWTGNTTACGPHVRVMPPPPGVRVGPTPGVHVVPPPLVGSDPDYRHDQRGRLKHHDMMQGQRQYNHGRHHHENGDFDDSDHD
jgi:hypothetical protein